METLRVARGACLCVLLLIAGVDGRDAGDASHTLSAQRPDWKDYAAMARWLVHSSSWGVLSTLEHGTGLPMGGVVSHSDGVDPSWAQPSTAAAGEAAGAAAATAAAGTAGAATGAAAIAVAFNSPSSTHLPLGLVASRKVLGSGTRTPAVSPLATDPGSRSRMAQHTRSHSLVQSETWPACTGRLFFYMTSMDFSCANVLASPASAFTVTESQLPGGCHGTDPEDPTCAKVTLVGHTVALEEEAERQLAQAALFSASGSGQQVQGQGQGQAAKVVIAERRQVIKAGLRGLVKAALPDLSPAQVDAIVAEINKRMTMGSKQCVLAAVLCLTPPAPAQDPPPPAQAPPPLPPAQAPLPPPAQPFPAAPGPVPRPQAPSWGRWLDRDTNPCLNFQRIGESKQRPLELCSWKDREALPPVGKEYQQGYKRVNDRLPKVKQRLHRAAEYRRGIDGRARNNA
ncbi:hypothetical protein QJQ45_007295 [Haematococcus lacustris]|nr:hypothetical protein QJQ45_007295 [Haematococcus lacustris]